MDKYVNLSAFEAWLQEIMARPFNFQACLDDLVEHHRTCVGCDGLHTYEMHGHHTKSGRLELFHYEVEYQPDPNDPDEIITCYIF